MRVLLPGTIRILLNTLKGIARQIFILVIILGRGAGILGRVLRKEMRIRIRCGWRRLLRFCVSAGGSLIFVIVSALLFAPLFTLMCTEVLVYALPVVLLLTFFVERGFRMVVVEEDDVVRECFLCCVELSVWNMLRRVYLYKHIMLVRYMVYRVLKAYICAFANESKNQNTIYVDMCRSFSWRRYCLSYSVCMSMSTC